MWGRVPVAGGGLWWGWGRFVGGNARGVGLDAVAGGVAVEMPCRGGGAGADSRL